MIEWATQRQKHSVTWDEKFLQVDPHFLFDIVVAADYLDVEDLLDFGCETIDKRIITAKSAREIKKIFNFKADITEDDDLEMGQERQVHTYTKCLKSELV